MWGDAGADLQSRSEGAQRTRREEGGGGESLIEDLERKGNALSRGTRQASALGMEGGPPGGGGESLTKDLKR